MKGCFNIVMKDCNQYLVGGGCAEQCLAQWYSGGDIKKLQWEGSWMVFRNLIPVDLLWKNQLEPWISFELVVLSSQGIPKISASQGRAEGVLILGTPCSKGVTQHKALANIHFSCDTRNFTRGEFYTIWRRLTYFVAKWDDASVVGK